jgi:flagellar protein FlbT
MSVLKISLRAGERIFINGAVLKPDRKVTLEFLNTVTFLLEQHVIAPEDTTTPLRQLYFMIQTAIIDPKSADEALSMAKQSVRLLQATFNNPEILANLEVVEHFISRGRHFECLRLLRKLYPLEQAIIEGRAVEHNEQPQGEHVKARVAL